MACCPCRSGAPTRGAAELTGSAALPCGGGPALPRGRRPSRQAEFKHMLARGAGAACPACAYAAGVCSGSGSYRPGELSVAAPTVGCMTSSPNSRESAWVLEAAIRTGAGRRSPMAAAARQAPRHRLLRPRDPDVACLHRALDLAGVQMLQTLFDVARPRDRGAPHARGGPGVLERPPFCREDRTWPLCWRHRPSQADGSGTYPWPEVRAPSARAECGMPVGREISCCGAAKRAHVYARAPFRRLRMRGGPRCRAGGVSRWNSSCGCCRVSSACAERVSPVFGAAVSP